MLVRTFQAFGTEVTLQVWPRRGQQAQAAMALRRTEASLHAAQRRLSRFEPDSELSRLNQPAGLPVRLSALTFAIVCAALEAAEATGGLFDPTVHHALVAAGYDRTFQELATPASGGSVPPAARGSAGRYREVQIDRRSRTVTLPPDVALDLGGIAKGWLADDAVRRLARHGAALADLGGDIACTPPPAGRRCWDIEVEDPRGGLPLGTLAVQRGGIATSGVTRRRWQTADGPRHHLIDPRTGQPAVVDLAAVTVVAPTATIAEVAAKSLLLMGSGHIRDTLALTPALSAVLAPAAGPAVFFGVDQRQWFAAAGEGGEPWRRAM